MSEDDLGTRLAEACLPFATRAAELAMEQERAAVVAWLRAQVAGDHEAGLRTVATLRLERAADAIERGDHLSPPPGMTSPERRRDGE